MPNANTTAELSGKKHGLAATQDPPPSVYAARGRFLSPTNSFRDKLPPVPAVVFTEERDRAFDPNGPTAAFPMDISDRLASPGPATTPLLLARYIHIRNGDTLRLDLRATAGLYYVIRALERALIARTNSLGRRAISSGFPGAAKQSTARIGMPFSGWLATSPKWLSIVWSRHRPIVRVSRSPIFLRPIRADTSKRCVRCRIRRMPLARSSFSRLPTMR